MAKLYLHDQEVIYVGTGPFGTFVKDSLGNSRCVFGHGASARDCLRAVPVRPLTFDCPNCDWTRVPVYKCGGSCDLGIRGAPMRFGKAGCE